MNDKDKYKRDGIEKEGMKEKRMKWRDKRTMKREKLIKGMGWKRKIKDERKKGWDKRTR